MQSEEDKKIGDEYIEKMGKFLEENLDPEEVDATREIPQKVIDELAKMGAFARLLSLSKLWSATRRERVLWPFCFAGGRA